MYEVREVDGTLFADTLHGFNSLAPETFPPLKLHHLESGFWWLAYLDDEAVAFAGLVPMTPFKGYGYLKRCYVKPDHYGHGLQFRLMCAREVKARQLEWTHLVSECLSTNSFSSRISSISPFTVNSRSKKPGDSRYSIFAPWNFALSR